MRTRYTLDGGSTVDVFKPPFGETDDAAYYFAIVDSNGRYPKAGKVAHNNGRDECITVLEGELTVVVDGKEQVVKINESILVPDGAVYQTHGKSKNHVFVRDRKDGKTEILDAANLTE